jgi:hypothetical protein
MTTATGKPRGRAKGCAKTGGRVAGKSLDRGARQLVSASLAGSILETFEQLGGTDAMIAWARANKTVFFTQILARLYPSPQRDDEPAGGTYNTQINFDSSPIECARRVAFLLATGLHDDPSRITPVEIAEIVADDVDEITPQQACDWREPIGQIEPLPEPVEDPAKAEWAASIPLTPEERQDQKLIKQTQTANISSYAGSGAEQGGYAQRPSVAGKPSAAQLCSRLSRRGRDLL